MKQTLPLVLSMRKLGFFVLLSVITAKAAAQDLKSDSLEIDLGKIKPNTLTENINSLEYNALNKGLVTSTEQAFKGNFNGILVETKGGDPGALALLKARKATSIYGKNTPLVVLDGVPLKYFTASDYTSALNFLNPHDIQSITFVSDAAVLAQYGSDATYGVLFISTKKNKAGTGTKISYSSTAGVSVLRKKAEIMSSSEFCDLIINELPDEQKYLGTANTDWQNAIFTRAFSHDQHISLTSSLLKRIPIYASAGYLSEKGILKTAGNKKSTINLALTPQFFENRLSISAFLKATQQKMNIANEMAIANARIFNPTLSIYQDNSVGGYYTITDENGDIHMGAPKNPLALLEQQNNVDETNTTILTGDISYKFKFLPALSIHARYLGLRANNFLNNRFLLFSGNLNNAIKADYNYLTKREVNKKWYDAFLLFDKEIPAIDSKMQINIGVAESQDENFVNNEYYINELAGRISNQYRKTKYNMSYGSLQYTYADKFHITAAVSNNTSTYFSNKKFLNKGIGVKWEAISKSDHPILNSLAFNANYSNYYNPSFNIPKDFISNYLSKDINLSPENIMKYQAGLTMEMLGNRLLTEISYFSSKLEGLLMLEYYGTYNGNRYSYFGNMLDTKSNGLEAKVSYTVLHDQKYSWDFSLLVGYSNNKVTNLYKGKEKIIYGDIMAIEKGYPVNSFYLLEQEYNTDGQPIPGAFNSDINGNAIATTQKQSVPTTTFGIKSSARYAAFGLEIFLRGGLGNYVYNYQEAMHSSLKNTGLNYLNNIGRSYYDSHFQNNYLQSNYYLENASFMRTEYIQASYDFGSILNARSNLSITATGQNLFVLTKYSGQDPEVAGGVDNSQYPQPTTISLGAVVNFK